MTAGAAWFIPARGRRRSASPGLWLLAWRRLARDPVAMVSLAIVVAFLAMMVVSGLGLVARDWSREIGVNYAPPTFVGPAPATDEASADAGRAGEPADGDEPYVMSIPDPIGNVLDELRAKLGRPAAQRSGTAGGAVAGSGGSGAVSGDRAVADDTGLVDPLADVLAELRRDIAGRAAGAAAAAGAVAGQGAAAGSATAPGAAGSASAPAGTGRIAGVEPVPQSEKRATLPLGADKWGRDVLKKAIKGSETSIFVGLAAALVATLLGTLFGALAGFYGRAIDDVFNWFYSVFTSIPYLLLILAIAAVLQQKGMLTIILILGLTGWTGIFRLVRAEYLKHKGREYVQAADAIGASSARQMFVHVFPNVSHVVLVQLSLHVVGFIKAEVILSFLGFGVPVDVVSWGSMLNEAQNELILGKWWQLAAAGTAMALLVTAFSLLTDALRDALDPRLK